MCSRLFAALVLVLTSTLEPQAQERKFPYQAIVEVDGEYVRSGPGHEQFYPTDKLRKGERVTVHRSDPGGWSMIAPPKGSFSWIRAEYVKKDGNGHGLLKSNRIAIHVGSSLKEDEITTIQGSLSQGDTVTILDERMIRFDESERLMYKIAPTRHEYRWIPTRSIVPADAIRTDVFPDRNAPKRKPTGPVAERFAQNDPIDVDSDPFGSANGVGESTGQFSPPSQNSRDSKSKQTLAGVDTTGFKTRLDEIDQQFRSMIKQEPSNWKLAEIQDQYAQLENEATQPTQSDMIAARMDTLSRYEKTQGEYLNFLRMVDEGRQRDAKLAAIQQQQENKLRELSGGGSGVLNPESSSQDTLALPVSSGNQSPMPPVPDPATSGVAAIGGSANSGQTATAPTFAGAGLVTPMARTFPGGPQFALIAPSGKLLAYLVPSQGVDLRRIGSQSVGVIGDRSFRQEWGADAIVVRGVQPVQLRTNK